MAGPKKYKDQTNKFDDILDKDFSATKNIFKFKHSDKQSKDKNLEFEYILKSDPNTRERSTDGKLKVEYDDIEVKATTNTSGSATGRLSYEKDEFKVGAGVDFNPWKDERTYVGEATYDKKPLNATVTASYGHKKGLDLVGVYKACKHFKVGTSLYLDLDTQRLTTYNFLCLFKLEKTRLMLEHQSVKSDFYGFGNLMIRALFKQSKRFEVAFRALLNSKTQENTFEVGGKGTDSSDITWRWKMANSGLLSLGASILLFKNDYSKLTGSMTTEVNAAKRNIFEDDLNWGLQLDYKTNGN